jgi:hypothetical protein
VKLNPSVTPVKKIVPEFLISLEESTVYIGPRTIFPPPFFLRKYFFPYREMAIVISNALILLLFLLLAHSFLSFYFNLNPMFPVSSVFFHISQIISAYFAFSFPSDIGPYSGGREVVCFST